MKKNILANFVGTGWVAFLTFVSVPLYVHYLGVEGYGLIGFFVTLQVIFLMLDFGLSAALTRELAYLSGLNNKESEMRNLLRSTEILYWSVALILALGVVAFSGIISTSWLRLESISPETAKKTILLMGLVLFFRWPVILYMGGVMGLQRQTLANGIKIVMETLRVGGVLLALHYYAATIEVFFYWQVLITALYAFVLRGALWHLMPRSSAGTSFSLPSLRSIWRFAAGMAGISVTAAILSQMDKIILSKYLVLKEFGYYSLASSLALGISQISTPISLAAYPRFTQLIAQGDLEKLKENYHKSCQWISAFVIPIALVIYFYSKEVLFVWTNDSELSLSAFVILKILGVGTCFNVLMTLPYNLQLAYKWTRLTFVSNLIAVCVLGPLLILTVRSWGSVGAASMWLILNISYLLINIQLMHQRVLSTEMKNWYWEDLLKPFLGAFAVVGLFYFLPTAHFSRVGLFFFLCSVTLLAMLGASLSTTYIRAWLFSTLRFRGI